MPKIVDQPNKSDGGGGVHKHDKVGYCLHIHRIQTSVYDHARQPAGRHYTTPTLYVLAEAVVKVKCYQTTALRASRGGRK